MRNRQIIARQKKIEKRLQRKAIAKGLVLTQFTNPKPTLLDDTMSIRIIFSGLGDTISKMLALEWTRHLKSVLYPAPVLEPVKNKWELIWIRDEAHRQELACADRSLLFIGPTPIADKFLKRYKMSKWVNEAGVIFDLD